MANERGVGKGIIRLEGPALVRPPSPSVRGGSLSPAAIELITGVRMVSGAVMSPHAAGARSEGHNTPAASTRTSSGLQNFADDWWGE